MKRYISFGVVFIIFASSCGGTSDSSNLEAIEKLEAQIEALSQQLQERSSTPDNETPTDENQKILKLQRESINSKYSWDIRSIEWKNFFDEIRK